MSRRFALLDRRVATGLGASIALLVGAWLLYTEAWSREESTPVALAATAPARDNASPGGTSATPVEPPAAARQLGVTAVEGLVERRRGAVSTPLAVGDLIDRTDVVSTGKGSSVELRNENAGVVVNVAPTSRLSLDELGERETRLTLEAGRLRAVAGKARGLHVSAAGGEASAHTVGGSFSMQADPGGAVRVYSHDKTVTLLARDAKLEVAAGAGAQVLPGQSPRALPLPSALLLKVRWPERKAQREHNVTVSGTTGSGALVRAGSSSVYADDKGRFALQIPLHDGSNRPQLIAEDLIGRRETSRAAGFILVDSRPPQIQHEGVRFAE